MAGPEEEVSTRRQSALGGRSARACEHSKEEHGQKGSAPFSIQLV